MDGSAAKSHVKTLQKGYIHQRAIQRRHRIRRVPYIGVPRAVVERRMQRGQLIGGPQARVPLYVPYADFFQYQAGAGRLAGRA